MNNKYKVLLLSITIMLVTSILLGTSYSLWSTTNTQSETNIVNVGCFTITFIDSGFSGAGDIDLKNQYPISDVEGSKLVPYKFSIKNECSIASSYVINLETSKESNFNLDYLKVKFNEETPAIYSTGLENGTIVLDSYSSSAKKLETGILEEGEEKIYTLRAWIEESATTTTPNVMGATWKGKVVVTNEATPLNNSKVTIVNNGETINEEVVARTRYTYDLTGIDLGSTTNIYCTNGAEPTMDNNTLVIDKIHEDTVCTTSNSIVDTIANKLSTTKTGIVMLDNEDNVEKMTIASTKEVVLDLNGKEIKGIGVNETSTTYNDNHVVFRVQGKLTINDSVGTGGVYSGTTCRAIDTSTGGTIIINGGNYNGRQSVYISGSNSNAAINGGNYSSKVWEAIALSDQCSNCNITINNGNFTSDSSDYIIYLNTGSTGKITINDGKINGRILSPGTTNQGTIEINGGTFTSTGRAISNNSGTVNINGGTFTSTGRTIENNSGTININGGNFESTGSNTIYNAASGTININGEQAIFDGDGNYASGVLIDNSSDVQNIINIGDLNIYNGTFKTDKYTMLLVNQNKGNVFIKNGLFEGGVGIQNFEGIMDINNIEVYNYASYSPFSGSCIRQENNDGQIKINNGTFDCKGYGIRNQGKGIINVKNANIKTYDYPAIINVNDSSTNGTINICKATLLNNKVIQTGSTGYIYYASNAFGSVTPTFAGTTANIQVKDDVCN